MALVLRFGSLTHIEYYWLHEMLLEEAPAALIPDLDSLNASAQQLLTLVNDIVSLAQQQLDSQHTTGSATFYSRARRLPRSFRVPPRRFRPLAKSS